MARHRGLLAELQHQAAVAQKNRERQQAASTREAARQRRAFEQAQASAVRAQAAAARADYRTQADAYSDAKRLYGESRLAEAESMTADAVAALESLEALLINGLAGPSVDLDSLRTTAAHPPFHSAHQTPTPSTPPVFGPLEPVFVAPESPSGLSGVFGRKKHEVAVETARTAFATQHAAWQAEMATVPARQAERTAQHQAVEAERRSRLAIDRERYDAQCREREKEADDANRELDELIRGYRRGEQAAVQDHLELAFSVARYPDSLDLHIDLTYDEQARELAVKLRIPPATALPTAKSFRWVKTKDEIAETSATLKEQRDRYANVAQSLALLTLHHVWASDDPRHIETVSLIVHVDHVDPATGRDVSTALLAVAADRARFEEIDLRRVTPADTLRHIGADLSKNFHALTPISMSPGLRG